MELEVKVEAPAGTRCSLSADAFASRVDGPAYREDSALFADNAVASESPTARRISRRRWCSSL